MSESTGPNTGSSGAHEDSLFHQVFRNSPDASALVRQEDGVLLEVNPAFERLSGYSREQLLNVSSVDLGFFPDADVRRSVMAEAITKGSIHEKVILTHHANGEPAYVSLSSMPIEFQGTACFLSTLRSVTQTKLTEKALAASEQRHRALLNALPDLIFRVDREGVFLDCFYHEARDLVLAPSDFIGTRITDHAFTREFGHEITVLIRESLDEDRVQTTTYTLDRDGEKKHFEARISPASKNEALVIIRNITARRRSEDMLRKSEIRYRRLFENAPIGILQVNADGGIVNANRKLLEVLHSPSKEATMQINMLTFPPLQEAGVADAVQRCLAGESFVDEHEYKSKWGAKGYYRIHYAPMYNDRGELSGAQLMVEDFTQARKANQERLALEKQILQSQNLESISVLAGGVAHDFNNLLAGIMGNADLALMQLDRDEPACDSIEKIMTSAERAAELTNQMLAYSGKGQFVIQAVNLTEIVNDILQLVRVSISKKANLSLRLEPDLDTIRADITQLRQIVMNLIINASDALGDKAGDITVETGMRELSLLELGDMMAAEDIQEGRFIYIRVVDTGCGMSRETLSKIFNPFFTTKFTGRGLGLSATLGIVRGHGGAIRVQSQPGVGTEFVLYFPSAGEVEIKPRLATQNGLVTGSGTILVIDDEDAVREFVTEVLTMAGYTVHAVDSGKEALELCVRRGDDFDLILLDLVMPGMSGEEVFFKLQEVCPRRPVILSSGFSKKEALGPFKRENVAGYLAKPFRAAALSRVVADILRQNGFETDTSNQ